MSLLSNVLQVHDKLYKATDADFKKASDLPKTGMPTRPGFPGGFRPPTEKTTKEYEKKYKDKDKTTKPDKKEEK